MSAATRRRRPAPAGRSLVRLGARIRSLRLTAGLAQADLGAPYLTRSAVSRIEVGKASPSFKVLVHFARRLKISVRQLIPPDL